MAVSQRFSIPAFLLWISIISYGVPAASSLGLICNVEIGALAKCNDAVSKLPAKSSHSPPSPTAPAPANASSNPSSDDANLPAVYSPAEAPTDDDDTTTDAFLTDEESGGADNPANAMAACCSIALNADIGCLCGFMSAPMLITIKFAEGFVNTVAQMCNIHFNGC